MGFISLFSKQQLLNLQSISNPSERAMILGGALGIFKITISITRQGNLFSPNDEKLVYIKGKYILTLRLLII